MNKFFSYNDLICLIETLSGKEFISTNYTKEGIELEEIQKLICFNNQFFHIIQFPAFKTLYISPSVSDVLGYHPKEMTLRKLYGLIHPEDYPIALLATKKMCEFVIDNYNNLKPFKSVMSMDFRIMHKDGHYIRLYNQNCIFKKDTDDKEFKALALSTDISHLKNNVQMEFNYTNNGDGVSCPFPDQELSEFSSLFTHRERQVLALLAVGKSSSEIGKMLRISRHTVDTHRRKMLSKSHLGNTTELVAYSISNNLIDESHL
ncbi:LuxR C-terminal-related transcriptional regulator [Labilibacter marinus]|uniref:LuxR C-terminal-related transcriptional regulator n=1 Tax=Labilibacter marinus TaxID=1477105 RepID=UPI0008328025|nr:LuxR C-terminal-related transcriptional regulator [Labilibacter marinus]